MPRRSPSALGANGQEMAGGGWSRVTWLELLRSCLRSRSSGRPADTPPRSRSSGGVHIRQIRLVGSSGQSWIVAPSMAGSRGSVSVTPEPLGQRLDLVVGARGIVVEQDHPAGAGPLGELHGVLGRGVPERRPRRELLGGVLRVVQEHVHAVGEGQCGLVVRAPALGAGAEGDRAVVGEVGHRRPTVADAVAERPPAGVGDLAGQHLEARQVVGALLEVVEGPGPAEARGRDGEVRRAHPTRQQLSGSASCAGISRRTSASGRSPAAKNGRPWVWSQCRWPSRIVPRNGSPSSRVVSRRKPVPASSTSVGTSASSWAMATHDVWPPTPANACPTAGVDPRTPQRWRRISERGDLPGDDPPPASRGGRGRAARPQPRRRGRR